MKQRIIDTINWCEQRKRDKPWYKGDDSPNMMLSSEFLKEICLILITAGIDVADNTDLIKQCDAVIINNSNSIFSDANMLVTCNFTIQKCEEALKCLKLTYP